MQGRTWRLGAAIAGAVAAFGAFSGSALAVTPSCSLGFTDPSGDAKDTTVQLVSANPVTLPGQDNEDILGGKVTTAPDGTVTVTTTIANLSKTKPADSTGVSWYYGYTIDAVGDAEYVSASTDGTGYTFEYGIVDPKTGIFTGDPNTVPTGRVTEGPNGTISIDLPDVFSGDTLSETYALSFQNLGFSNDEVGSLSSLSQSDAAPDGGGDGGTNNPSCLVS